MADPVKIPEINKIKDDVSIEQQTLETLQALNSFLNKQAMNKTKSATESSLIKSHRESSGGGGNLGKSKDWLAENVINTALGPFRLLTESFEKISGINLQKNIEKVFIKATKGMKPKKKINPNKEDLSQTEAGQAELYRENQDKLKNKMNQNPDFMRMFATGFGGSMLGGIMKSVGQVLLKVAPWAAIATGLVLMVFDGIKGELMAKKWKVSNLAAIFGAALAGTSSGLKGAFSNFGKWALIGAGIGTLVAPGLGTIIGGLAGAIIGAILGYIGGKNLAKLFDNIGKWFSNIVGNIDKSLTEVGKKNPVFNIFLKGAKAVFDFIFSPIVNFFSDIFKTFTDIFMIWTSGKGSVATKIAKTLTTFVSGFFGAFSKLLIDHLFIGVPKMLGNFLIGILPDLKKIDFAKILGDVIRGIFKIFTDPTHSQGFFNMMSDVVDGIKKAFADFFGGLFGSLMNFVKDVISNPIAFFASFGGGEKETKAWSDIRKTQSDKRLKQNILDINKNYDDQIKALGTGAKKTDEYKARVADIEKNRKHDLEQAPLNSMATGGIAKEGLYRYAEPGNPEMVIPIKKIAQVERGFDNAPIQNILSSLSKNNKNDYNNEMVKGIKELIEVVKKKEFAANIIPTNNQTSVDFNSIRMLSSQGRA